MDLYQRVWGEKFVLTEEEKSDILAGKPVSWQGELVKHAGTARFHILYKTGDMDKPVYEGQWLIKKDGAIEILWDEQAKGKYLFAAPKELAPEEFKPFQSDALKRFLESKKAPVEDSTSDEKQPEPSKVTDESGEELTETLNGAPVYDAPKNDEPSLPITGQAELPAEEQTKTEAE